MKRFLLIVFMSIGLFLSSCQQNINDQFPRISLQEQANQKFTFTNKQSGFYLGNSHQQNIDGHSGWTVNEIHYLRDYRFSLINQEITRDSITAFHYYPSHFTRHYISGIEETFTLIDSLDVIIWEFEAQRDISGLVFEPLLHRSIAGKNMRLTADHSTIILSPPELGSENSQSQIGWLGFKHMKESDQRLVILAVIEKSEASLNNQLSRITEKYSDLQKQRARRIARLMAMNKLSTNIPEITEAITWSQLSLDALVTRQRGKGIWAGLPWFNNYWGRDTFISFCGAFLVSGKFDEAKEVIHSFSRFQLQDENDPWFGRIPNRVTNNEIIYNTTDATWWFIREVYEYILYSGDITFAKQIYPVIERAIQGALKYRIDEYFFLIHEDADTWMDAKGPQGPWSPRGNRAVEIQALWYTALQAAAQIAGLNDQHSFKEHWLAVSETLKTNFQRKYWHSFKNEMTDHLNADGSRDKKLRPNQIFTVFVPQLPAIQPLISEEMSAFVTSTVLTHLTYHYGVASLWQNDKDFHPWHHYQPYYVPDEAYHNGTVWTWLAGPVISSLMMFNQSSLAYGLYYDQAIQVLYNDAIGNYSELLEAIPREGSGRPKISGTVAQAWSLAEYCRNFYQDFIGYQPNALQNKISMRPLFPNEIRFVTAQLPWKESWLYFSYLKSEEKYRFEISLIDGHDSVRVTLALPGFDSVDFNLDQSEPQFTIEYERKDQRYYHHYAHLEWYFAQPQLAEDLTALRDPGYPVLSSTDFYLQNDTPGTIILQATDPVFDDKGVSGTYIYPLSLHFPDGILDIEAVKIEDRGDQWGFIISMRNLYNPNWHPEYGFQGTFLAIALNYPHVKQSTRKQVGQNAYYSLPASRAYHDIIYVGGGIQIEDDQGAIKVQYYPDNMKKPLGFTNEKEIRFRIDKKYLPFLDKQTRITVLSGAQDDHGGAGIGEFRLVKRPPGEWHGGGARKDEGESRVYDVLEIN